MSAIVSVLPSPSLGLRNPPRPLLVAGPSSAGSGDSDGGLFAVPTTLPPNSRHGKLFSPNKETELTFRQHLNSISVSGAHASLLLACPMCVEKTLSGSVLSSSQMQSDFFLPKPRKLRNRHLRKPLVVQVRSPSTSACAWPQGLASPSHQLSCPGHTSVLLHLRFSCEVGRIPAPSFLLFSRIK